MTPNKKLWVAIALIMLVIIMLFKISLISHWLERHHSHDMLRDKNYCSEPRGEFCPEYYHPVCGWFNQSVQCLKYPCANTYSNSCFACTDTHVSYWTEGMCPS